jgi:hypothetical protein
MTQMTLYRGPRAADLDQIPAGLKGLRQWVLWRGADRVNTQTGEVKLNKTPTCPQTLRNADTTDALTWGTLAQCVDALPVALEEWEQEAGPAYRGGGIGFVFTSEDAYCGIDLDECVDPDTRHIATWAQTHVRSLASYTEITPSGTGLHILVQGTLPPRGRKKGAVEMYDYARFFTMTGWHVAGTPETIEDRQAALETFHTTIFGTTQSPQDPAPSGVVTLDDTALLSKAQAAKNGARVAALFAGDWTGYGSWSEADMSLCVRLAFWSQSPAQIDRLFRQSGLMRKKWDEMRGPQTYGARTIAEALARQTEHYRAVDASSQHPNGSPPGPEPTDPYACPELPDYATTNHASAQETSLFLDDYITLSTKWAPRAYSGFHEAVALFLLSTLAARRIKLVFGPRGTYTSLYIALAARTTVYTKSTTADIGMALLDAAGLSWLLADDDSTPQAFLRSLSLYVPSNYADMPPEEQEHLRRQLAFTAQRGWFYEEWGQHLEAMMQKNGYMAGFRSILRRLDDHKDRYVSNTIARGREILHKPYVSLLANVTPSDLQPFVKARSSLWRDGYIARFAFVTPDQAEGSAAEFPEGSLTFPGYLVKTLHHWHTRLWVPTCILTPRTDKKGQPLGTYTLDVDPLPEKVYTLHPEVRTAYYAYDRAMRELTRQRKDEDLDGSYGRFPGKALRIAGLLASLHDDSDSYTVWPRHWWRGQQIVERWRQGLHRLMQQVQTTEVPSSPKRQLEEKLLRQVTRSGPQTMRDFATYQKTHSRDEIDACVKTLVAAGELVEYHTPKALRYGCPTATGPQGEQVQ